VVRNAGVTLDCCGPMRDGAGGEGPQTLSPLLQMNAAVGKRVLAGSPMVLLAAILRGPEGDGCALPGIQAVGIVSA
jgi:hypothetical protein